MSILIKGMEMPTSCFYCPMRLKVDPDNIKCLATGDVFEETFTATIEMRNGGKCPLVPIPPHGRLIDADALVDKHFGKEFLAKVMTADEDDLGTALVNIPLVINNAPTILPAEEGET